MPIRAGGEFDAFELSEARKEMLERKAAIIAAMPEWQPRQWEKSTVEQRWETLNKTERLFAVLEKRGALPVTPLGNDIVQMCIKADIELPYGLTREAYGTSLRIELNPKLVAEHEPDRAMKTYFHEEHHVEQTLTISKPELRADFSTRQREAWELDRKYEAVVQFVRDIPNEEMRSFAHEKSADLESLRLYTRCLNKVELEPGRGNPEPRRDDREAGLETPRSALEEFVYDHADERTKSDQEGRKFKSRLEEFVSEPVSKDRNEPNKQPTAEPAKVKEEHEPQR